MEKKIRDKGSLLDVIREVPRYHLEFGGGEVGNDKQGWGGYPVSTSILPWCTLPGELPCIWSTEGFTSSHSLNHLFTYINVNKMVSMFSGSILGISEKLHL